ncbi:MAG: DUF1836 domain-containing protein [Syntrophomonadaceae bacterium]|nr:DUF1836 domain-containing protein [Syntrophomonadaceae bacterium]
MFNAEEISRLIGEISLGEEVLLSDIPDIDLYMDQVTAFMDRKLAHLKRHEKDKLLTKTMINNYTKAELLMPPAKKKYTRQHIALLFMIYNSKQILSINDIAMLLSPMKEDGHSFQNEPRKHNDYIWIDTVYELIHETRRDETMQLMEECGEQARAIDEKVSALQCQEQEQLKWFLMVMFLVSQAALQKRLAETIIDRYFDTPSPAKNKQK